MVARRDKERERERERERARDRVAQTVANTKRWRRQHPERQAAHNAVARALRKGTLVRQPCEKGPEGCGPGTVHAHHDDYSKPLEVRWLCALHHAEER